MSSARSSTPSKTPTDSDNAEEVKNIDGDELIEAKHYAAIAVAASILGDSTSKNVNNKQEEATPPPKKPQKLQDHVLYPYTKMILMIKILATNKYYSKRQVRLMMLFPN